MEIHSWLWGKSWWKGKGANKEGIWRSCEVQRSCRQPLGTAELGFTLALPVWQDIFPRPNALSTPAQENNLWLEKVNCWTNENCRESQEDSLNALGLLAPSWHLLPFTFYNTIQGPSLPQRLRGCAWKKMSLWHIWKWSSTFPDPFEPSYRPYLPCVPPCLPVLKGDLLENCIPILAKEDHQMPGYGASLTCRNNLELFSVQQSTPWKAICFLLQHFAV